MKSLVIRVLSRLRLLDALLSFERSAIAVSERARELVFRRRAARLRRRRSKPTERVVFYQGRPLVAVQTDEFDHVTHAAAVVQAVLDAASSAGASSWRVASDRHGRTRVAIAGKRVSVVESLRTTHPTLAIGYRGAEPAIRHLQALSTAAVRRLAHRPLLVVAQPVLAPNGALDIGDWGACEIEEWNCLTSETETRFVARVPNPVASSIPASLVTNRRDVNEDLDAFPHRLEDLDPPFDIDIVYTWVDGNDAAWRQRRQEYLGAPDPLGPIDGTTDDRFCHSDELRYSLRSLWYYARFFRHVFLVTDGQRPTWIAPSPHLTLVDHREIFPRPTDLPVFNSHAIESNLHRIPGLAAHYVYMNDDVFFGRPTPWTTFFDAAGATKFAVSDAEIPFAPRSRASSVDFAGANGQRLLNGTFGWAPTRKIKHTPHAQSRDVVTDMERRWPRLFEEVARSRFRSRSDVSVAAFLHHYYALAIGRAQITEMDYDYIHLNRQDLEPVLARTLRTRPAVFCVNDGPMGPLSRVTADATLTRFLRRMYPHSAPWESDER